LSAHDATVLSLLFLAGALGGALNSVAGGGSFVVFPALLFSGLTPVIANATCAAGLLPASGASAFAYRKDVARDRLFGVLVVASLVGGAIGAVVLLSTRESTFEWVLPLLLAFAAAVFSFGGSLAMKLRGAIDRARAADASHGKLLLLVVFAVQVVIATYGGYFGGGMGILMLATFAFAGMSDIHAMNGAKSVLAVVINGAAVALFAYAGKIVLARFAIVAIGGVVGGYFGARIARKIPAKKVRVAVIVYAWAMTAYFAWRTYR
jgi:uncharacterized membrane protein YfcA